MKINFKILAILILPFFLAACPTNQDYFGTGPISLDASNLVGFENYKRAGINAGYFAVTEDGTWYGYSYCPAGQCSGNTLMLAINSCENNSKGRECRIYAEGRTVVWDSSKPPGNNP